MGEEKAQDWRALARAVTDRRVELGHRTLRAFAQASGLSTKTLGEIEGAKRASYDRATLSQIERQLRWPAGTVAAILAEGATAVPVTVVDATLGTSFAVPRAVMSAAELLASVDDGPDPIEEKLSRLHLLDHTLNPADRARLRTNLDMLLEWAYARGGVPEMSDEDRAALEQFQATIAAHNEQQRKTGPPLIPKPPAHMRVPQEHARSDG